MAYNVAFETIGQAHVALETGPIECITEKGVQLENAELPFDLIILATGFRAQDSLSGIELVDSDGEKLGSDTETGLHAYYGVVAENLPNFAMLYGPNTNLIHVSVMLVIKAQARYISVLVGVLEDAAKRNSSLVIRPKSQAIKKYNEVLQASLKQTVFADPGCRSRYKAKNGVTTNSWSGTAMQYQNDLSTLNWHDYDIADSELSSFTKRGMLYLGGPVEIFPAPFFVCLAWVVSTGLNLLKQSRNSRLDKENM